MSAKFLIDANLSWRLTRLLQRDFPEVKHVSKVRLGGGTPDIKIWDYALHNGFTIITNDEDFLLLSVVKGFPPKVILLQTGNQSTLYIARLLSKHKEKIVQFLNSEDYGVFEIF